MSKLEVRGGKEKLRWHCKDCVLKQNAENLKKKKNIVSFIICTPVINSHTVTPKSGDNASSCPEGY